MFTHKQSEEYSIFEVYCIYDDLGEEIAMVDKEGIIYGSPSLAVKTTLLMTSHEWKELFSYILMNIGNEYLKMQTYSVYKTK